MKNLFTFLKLCNNDKNKFWYLIRHHSFVTIWKATGKEKVKQHYMNIYIYKVLEVFCESNEKSVGYSNFVKLQPENTLLIEETPNNQVHYSWKLLAQNGSNWSQVWQVNLLSHFLFYHWNLVNLFQTVHTLSLKFSEFVSNTSHSWTFVKKEVKKKMKICTKEIQGSTKNLFG